MNALVIIDTETLTPAVFSQDGGIDAMLAKLEQDVRAIPTDVSTPAGRKAIASLAHKVARSKTAFDDMGKDLVADLKKQTGAIDAERKKVRDRLDALKEEVRKPLDDYEAAEARRIADHQMALQAIIDLGTFASDMPAGADVIAALTALDGLPDRDWQEFKQKAATARSETFAKLQALKGAALTREAEAAELERLRAEQAVRDQQERDARIAAEAAANATREAEARAAQEATRVAEAAAAAQRKAEEDRAAAVALAEKAQRDAADAADKAERDRVAAIESAEADQRAAVLAERQRVADAAAAEAAEVARREADTAHKKDINNAAKRALVEAGLSEFDAIKAITAIVKGVVPCIRISY